MHRVVITGIGVITPIGTGVKRFWQAALAGKSGVGPISLFDASGYPSRIAGEVRDFRSSAYMSRSSARRMSRFAQFAVAAARLASEDASFVITDENRNDVGICMGVGIVGAEPFCSEMTKLRDRGCSAVSRYAAAASHPGAASGNISVELGIHGECQTISTGCSSGSNALGYAFRCVRSGTVKSMLAGGAEACIAPLVLATFCRARALSTHNSSPEEASRPFDRDRDGFVMGEAAAVLVVETLESAQARGVEPYAEIVGYSCTSDAYSMVKIEKDGHQAIRAVEACLKEAGLPPEELGYICAHGSSSLLADRRETHVLKKSLGKTARRVPISSIKSMIGQPLGASGAVQTAVCALALREKKVPPTINYRRRDPDCDLDYVPNEARETEARAALALSLGMGGNNACLALRRL